MEREFEYDLDFSSKSQVKKTESLYRNFIIFCVCFSVTHGSMDSVLAYASSELGPSLASYAGFVLYLFYTLSALLIAKPTVQYLGPKNGVILGLFCFLCYVFSFLMSIVITSAAWPMFLFGACLGGTGAGIAWTAQASYYSRNAQQYGSIGHSIQTKVNADFAAIFAGIYLGFETCTAVSATIIYLTFQGNTAWREVVFGLYSILSLCAMVLCTNIYPLDMEAPPQFEMKGFLKEVFSVGRSIFQSKRLILLLPYQICFGLHAGFIGQYVNRKIVTHNLGDGYLGMVTALATLSAALLAIPYARIANKSSKYMVMVFGALCFAFCGFSLLISSDEK
eukprot:gene4037-8035_t